MKFGFEDNSYQAAGGEAGLRQLCIDFYEEMQLFPEGLHIFQMHKKDLAVTIDKLCLFLCGWLGGPKRYHEKYGPIHIPGAHQHLVINEKERDAWLTSMSRALVRQPYSAEFKDYLNQQFKIPADKIWRTARK